MATANATSRATWPPTMSWWHGRDLGGGELTGDVPAAVR
jgi:hypothetical protein